MKNWKKFNESFGVEDFELIFQDIKDDFPEIKWEFNPNISSILTFLIRQKEMDPFLLKKANMPFSKPFEVRMYYPYSKNLIGYSNTLALNDLGDQYLHFGSKEYSKNLYPYFNQIKNRLLDQGIKIGFYKREIKARRQYDLNEFFRYTIILKK